MCGPILLKQRPEAPRARDARIAGGRCAIAGGQNLCRRAARIAGSLPLLHGGAESFTRDPWQNLPVLSGSHIQPSAALHARRAGSPGRPGTGRPQTRSCSGERRLQQSAEATNVKLPPTPVHPIAASSIARKQVLLLCARPDHAHTVAGEHGPTVPVRTESLLAERYAAMIAALH
jgi:hypothetical protein